jgi:hypothetical protein
MVYFALQTEPSIIHYEKAFGGPSAKYYWVVSWVFGGKLEH